jgi:hypothetical protein
LNEKLIFCEAKKSGAGVYVGIDEGLEIATRGIYVKLLFYPYFVFEERAWFLGFIVKN